MQIAKLDRSFSSAFLVVLLITIFRLIWLWVVNIPLYADEAQYWYWSLEPAFGYYSKPPVIAWVISLSTKFLGDSEFAIRFFAPILHGFTSVVIYFLALKIFPSGRTAFWSSITYLTLPSIFLSSLIISTDVPLLLITSLSLYLFYCIQDSRKFLPWIVLGFICGIGLLTKYHFAIFAFAAFIYLWSTEKLATHLRNPALYIGIITAFLVFLPNLIWNYQNHFVSLQHTSELAGFGSLWQLPLARIAKFFGDQFIVFGPILLVYFLCLFPAFKKSRLNQETKFLLSFGMSFLAVIGVVCILNKSHANWTAPAYLPLLILVVHYMIQRSSKWLRINFAMQLILGGLFLLAPIAIESLDFKYTKFDIFKRMRGYDQLAVELDEVRVYYPDDKYDYVTDDRKTYAWLVYYTEPHLFTLKRIAEYDYIPDHFAMKNPYIPSNKPAITISKSINCKLQFYGKEFKGVKIAKIGDKFADKFYICLFEGLN